MKKRFKTIMSGLWIVLLAIIGVIEYIQLMKFIDLPQVVLVMPIVGALAMATLGKKSFVVPAATIIMSILYQVVSKDAKAIDINGFSGNETVMIILKVLPLVIIFEMIGIGGGALIRQLVTKKQVKIKNIILTVLGVIIVCLPYGYLFQNPVYPIMARVNLGNYSSEKTKEATEKIIYFDLGSSCYKCKMTAPDGAVMAVLDYVDGKVVVE